MTRAWNCFCLTVSRSLVSGHVIAPIPFKKTLSAFLTALEDSRYQAQASNRSGFCVHKPLLNIKSNTSKGLAERAAYFSQISTNLWSLFTDFSSLNCLMQLSMSLSIPPSLPPLGYSCSTQEMYLRKLTLVGCVVWP